MPAMWPMLMNTAGGARSIPHGLRDVARDAPALAARRRSARSSCPRPPRRCSSARGSRWRPRSWSASSRRCSDCRAGSATSSCSSSRRISRRAMWAYVFVIGCLGILVNFGLVRLVRVLFPGVSAASERSHRVSLAIAARSRTVRGPARYLAARRQHRLGHRCRRRRRGGRRSSRSSRAARSGRRLRRRCCCTSKGS